MTLPKYAFFKDRIVPYDQAKVGILTHGLNYGTAVFGGIRGYWNPEEAQLHVFRLKDHCRRFLQSAKLLCMDLSLTEESLFQTVIDLLRAEQFHEDCYIRPLAFYGDEIIGVRLHNLTPILGIAAIPFGRYVQKEEGTHVTISSWRRVDDNMIPPRGKIAGSYVNSAFIKTDAQRAGFDEAIVLNQDGHVCEGSAENLFVIRDGTAFTPPVTDNILEGITRRSVITVLQDELRVPVIERSIDRTELYLADEMFFVGTGVQIAAIIKIDNRLVGQGTMGQVTKDIRDLYFNIVRGRVQKYRQWCSPVYVGKTAERAVQSL